MKKVVSILVVLAFATAAQAAVSASVASATPTPGLVGFTTYIINGNVTGGGVVEGASTQLVAPLNDLSQLMVGATTYADLNGFLAVPAQDTQTPWITNTDVLSALANETTAAHNTDWAFIGGVGNPNALPSTPILQVCLPSASSATLNGLILSGGAQTPFAPLVIPEPASLALLGMGGLGVLLRRKR